MTKNVAVVIYVQFYKLSNMISHWNQRFSCLLVVGYSFFLCELFGKSFYFNNSAQNWALWMRYGICVGLVMTTTTSSRSTDRGGRSHVSRVVVMTTNRGDFSVLPILL